MLQQLLAQLGHETLQEMAGSSAHRSGAGGGFAQSWLYMLSLTQKPWLQRVDTQLWSGMLMYSPATCPTLLETLPTAAMHAQPYGGGAAAAAAALLWKDMQMGGSTLQMDRMLEGMVHRPSPAISPEAAAGTCTRMQPTIASRL